MNRIAEARSAFYGTRDREGRSARPREFRRRTFEVTQQRDSADGPAALGLIGYASVTDMPYTVTDWLGDYTETIERGAFAKTLADRDDVRLLVNHEGIPLARTKSGTMSLDEDDHGLRVDVPSLDQSSPNVQSVRSAMSRGDADEMSFAFMATRQEWNEDYTERTIREVKLYDVSVVTYPASEATSVKLRSRWTEIDAALREGRALDPEDLNMLTQSLGWFSAVDNIVDEAQESLAAYMGVPNPDADDDASDDAGMGYDAGRALDRLRLQAAIARSRAAA